MNLYRVTIGVGSCELVVAASEKQAAGLIADELNNYRWTGTTFQWLDFDVKEIDIDSFRTPTIL